VRSAKQARKRSRSNLIGNREELSTSHQLGDMHRLKEELRTTFENRDSEIIGLLNLADWLRDAASKLPKSCGTIIRWLGEIIPYFKNRTTQGIVQGINNKLK